MATPRKGWRTIAVDEKKFRWTIRHQPEYFDNISRAGIRFTVESASGSLLVVKLARPRLDYWMKEDSQPVTPKEVADWIKKAITLQWNPEVKSKPFVLSE